MIDCSPGRLVNAEKQKPGTSPGFVTLLCASCFDVETEISPWAGAGTP
jgi:hypothetical protein